MKYLVFASVIQTVTLLPLQCIVRSQKSISMLRSRISKEDFYVFLTLNVVLTQLWHHNNIPIASRTAAACSNTYMAHDLVHSTIH